MTKHESPYIDFILADIKALDRCKDTIQICYVKKKVDTFIFRAAFEEWNLQRKIEEMQ